MKIISISNLSVNYGAFLALSSVDLDIFPGDFLGVIGPNGGGKTTLVKAILQEVPYTGTIKYKDEADSPESVRIGYLPQQNKIDRNFPISVAEVVLSGLQSEKKFKHSYSIGDKTLAKNLLSEVGIADIAGKHIAEISGGQFQRALLCRAIISDPELLILDEPATFVDNKFETELYEILTRLNQKMAIVMVSHDVGTITSVVKDIVCVNKTVHRHHSNHITAEQLDNYGCPIQLVTHGDVPHTVLRKH